MKNFRTSIFVSVYVCLIGFTLPANAQDTERASGAHKRNLASMVFDGYVPMDDAAKPAEGCSEEAVEVCAKQFYEFLEKLDGDTAGTEPDLANQYDISALMSGVVACDNGDGQSCYLMGTLYSDPPLEAHEPNLREAVAHYDAACDLDFGAGCGAVAYYGDRAALGIPAEHRASVAKKGCMLDDENSCTYYGLYASQGVGMEVDPMLTFAAFLKACDLSSAAGCSNVGAMYEYGNFVPQSIERASGYYDWGCRLGNAGACQSMTRVHAEDGPLPDAARVTEARTRGCEIDAALCAD